jgi:hypothetical protein
LKQNYEGGDKKGTDVEFGIQGKYTFEQIETNPLRSKVARDLQRNEFLIWVSFK